MATLRNPHTALLLIVLVSLAVICGCMTGKSTATAGPTPTPTPQLSSHSVDVLWDPSPSGNLQGYKVYRSQVSGGPYNSISGILNTGTSQFADTNVFVGTTYFYVVTSVDMTGLESAQSPEVSITVPTS